MWNFIQVCDSDTISTNSSTNVIKTKHQKNVNFTTWSKPEISEGLSSCDQVSPLRSSVGGRRPRNWCNWVGPIKFLYFLVPTLFVYFFFSHSIYLFFLLKHQVSMFFQYLYEHHKKFFSLQNIVDFIKYSRVTNKCSYNSKLILI